MDPPHSNPGVPAALGLVVSCLLLTPLTGAAMVPPDPAMAWTAGASEARPAPQQGDATCGGFAPLVTDCATGPHALTPDAFALFHFWRPPCGRSLGSGLPPSVLTLCFAGDAQSVVTGPLGQRITTCRGVILPGGVSTGLTCTTTGPELADLGSPVMHGCHVRALATADAAVAGSGLPGGVGEWSCVALHD